MVEIPHNQSFMADIPHNQSALSKCWEPTHIRTLQTEDEEAFPTSPHTGHSQKTHILWEPISTSPIYEPQIPQLQTRSLNAHNIRPQSSAQFLLSRKLLSLPRQELGRWSGFPLHPLHPIPSAHYSYPSWAPDYRTSAEIQCHQQLP